MENKEKLQDVQIEDLDNDESSNNLKTWIIAIVVTAVAIYAVPTLLGMVL